MSDVRYKVLVHRKTGTTTHGISEGREILFGRDPDCTVMLAEARVSRRHAVLRVRGGALEFSDLGSRNGSTVDGNAVDPNGFVPVRPTSVIRIGDAVLVFEVAHAAATERWCFDQGTFDKRASDLLTASRAKRAAVGLIELRWTAKQNIASSTSTNASPVEVTHLQQVFARIVGAAGLVGAHDPSGIVLLCANTDSEKLDASAALLKEICDEHGIEIQLRTAVSAEAQSVQALLLQASRGPGALAPPVIFHGSLHSIDRLVARLDASDAPVLIVGETGVGKDVLARTLHGRSRRANKSFVALNCAAFTEALFESELFGHERGAFTGAAQAKTGLLESAAGGTVFLDEIGEMPLGLQAKLLRVVENREVLRVGGLQPKQIDVRFIFATNRDLRREIELKAFRSDLFFRISSISLKIPPLRERVDEIVPLAAHFIETAAKRIGRPVPRLLPEAQRFLLDHSWPGNIRELKNVIELAVLVHEGEVIRPADIHVERYVPMNDDEVPSSKRAFARESSPDLGVLEEPRAPRSVDPSTERARIVDALERTAWNQSAAAKLLGMPRRTFVKRLAQYELPRPRKRET